MCQSSDTQIKFIQYFIISNRWEPRGTLTLVLVAFLHAPRGAARFTRAQSGPSHQMLGTFANCKRNWHQRLPGAATPAELQCGSAEINQGPRCTGGLAKCSNVTTTE